MKGQTKIEFVFSLVFFSILILFLTLQVTSNISSALSDSYFDSLRARAWSLADILVRTQGDPPNWEVNPASARYIGLASEPFNLSEAKLREVQNNCNLLNKTVRGPYRLVVYDEYGTLIVECGFGGPELSSGVTVPVFIGDRFGTLTLVVW